MGFGATPHNKEAIKMAKRIICLLMLITIMPIFAYSEQVIPAVYLNEEFTEYKGGTPYGWNPKAQDLMFAETIDEERGISLKTSPNEAAPDVNFSKGFKSSITGNVVMSADIYSGDTDNQRAVFIFLDSSGTENYFLLMDKGDILQMPEKTKIAGFKPKEWLRIEVAIDISAKKYDLFLNGNKIVSGGEFPKPEFGNVKTIFFKSWKGGDTHYDNIRVYEAKKPLNDTEFYALLAKQSERMTDEQIMKNKLAGALVLCVGNKYALIKNEQVPISETSPLMPIKSDNVIYIPLNYVREILNFEGEFSSKGKTIESNGDILVSARELAEAMGKEIFIDNRGLIILSDIKDIFDPAKDIDIINEILNTVSYRAINPDDITQEIYKQLRDKWKMRLIGDGTHDMTDPDILQQVENANKSAKDLLGSLMKGDVDRPYLWDECKGTDLSKYVTMNYDRVKKLSVAYGLKGGELYQNQELKNTIISCLDWLYKNRYNETQTPYENWWEWEIGTPNQLNDVLAIMYDELSPERIKQHTDSIDHFISSVPDGNTGANRVWKSMVIAVRAIMAQDYEKVIRGRDALLQTFDYSVAGDGFYEDGSFIQHAKHAYTMGYGKSMLADLCNAMAFFENTIFEITNPKKNNIYDWIDNSFDPLIYKGAAMQMASGREISRNYDDHYVGHQVVRAILTASTFAPEDKKPKLQSMVKTWVTEDTVRNFVATVPFNLMVEAKKLINDENVPDREPLTLYKQYAAMDEAVIRNKNFAFAVSLSSERCATFESINNENLKGWYMNDGMTYIYNDLDQYTREYWPTVNPYRLPGITVDSRKKADGEGTGKKTKYDFVGGVEIDKTYGVTAMEFGGLNSTLHAKKSYFMFDDEVVCMGTEINSDEGLEVDTIVENRRINEEGDNALTVNGEAAAEEKGETVDIENTLWAHLKGSTDGADIGYYFPAEGNVKFLREERTGTWLDINKNYGTDRKFTRNYLNIWLSHGKNPKNDSYYYALLPSKTVEETDAYAKKPDIRILRNSPELQAVSEKNTGVTGIVFWEKGEMSYIKAANKCIVGITDKDGQLSIAVSDPTQKQTKITLEVKLPKLQLIEAAEGMEITQTSSNVTITINTKETLGKTFEAVFKRS